MKIFLLFYEDSISCNYTIQASNFLGSQIFFYFEQKKKTKCMFDVGQIILDSGLIAISDFEFELYA